MKEEYIKSKKILRKIYIIIGIVCFFCSVPIFLLRFNAGRTILINGINSYLKNYEIRIAVEDINEDCSKISKLSLEKTNDFKVEFSNIYFQKLFPKIKVSISQIIFNDSNDKLNQTNKNTVDTRIKNSNENFSFHNKLIVLLKILRAYVKEMSIDKVVAKISNSQYQLEKIKYLSEKNNDKLSLKIKNKQCNFKIEWDSGSFKRIKVAFNDFISDFPKIIKQNFENIDLIATIKNASPNAIDLNFEKNNKSIGNTTIILQNEAIKIIGNVDWIHIFNYRLKKIECSIYKLKKIDAKIYVDNFTARLTGDIEKNRFIDNIKVHIPKYGVIKSKKTIDIMNPKKLDFMFKFEKLNFLHKIIPIFGDISGNFSFENNEIKTDCSGKKITVADNNFANYHLSVDKKNISIKSESAFFFNIVLNDFFLELNNQKLNLNAKVKNKTPDALSVSYSGKVSKSLQKISMGKFSLTSKDIQCVSKIFDLDFEKGKYKINCEIDNKKIKKRGSVQFDIEKNNVLAKFDSFQPSILNKIFEIKIPKCFITGTARSKISEKNLSGTGRLIISELFAKRKESIELNLDILNNNMQLNAQLKNSKNKLDANIVIPVSNHFFDKDFNFEKYLSTVTLKCRIISKARLENIFVLPDKSDVRGAFDCNLTVSGSFKNPKIDGNANLRKAQFIIDDVFLRNGNISLKCSANNIRVSHAEFVNKKNQKMIITGGGIFFFEGLIPNIKTNLDLNCINFPLFDSEDLNVTVNGKGKITGTLNDLLISGNVDIIKCKIQNMDALSGDVKEGIIIENEINVKNKSKDKNKEKDFCSYDISMHCPKISVIGSVFDMILSGDLKLSSFEHQATLIGELKLKKGKIDLFGKRIIMRKGNVEFLERYPFDPKVSLLCSNNFGELLVYLKIKNSPQKGVAIELSSVPNRSQELILSQILFGKDMKYLSVSEAAQFAHAMSSLKQSGYIFSILNTFKKSGIVDTISFSSSDNSMNNSLNTNSQTANGPKNVNISAGKYIGDNIFISVNKNSDESTSFDVDYSITPNISIKANTNGEAGISWKYKY